MLNVNLPTTRGIVFATYAALEDFSKATGAIVVASLVRIFDFVVLFLVNMRDFRFWNAPVDTAESGPSMDQSCSVSAELHRQVPVVGTRDIAYQVPEPLLFAHLTQKVCCTSGLLT